ncbi:hypothetical protein Aph01nite_62450 [Acrocarpospora phusangensis]|uniref:Uncharacterized protein n=1 Tax=Acrocarpospora phusangensis TaxID=1070424 RepID=A0A919UU00_9ACTN|nr:hypothetical protein [Acrocarpospora phusangensis]GIH27935.1 hypothetical protein Aph01nite_62450 [Acrocarpospora phusangensis]
MTLHVTADRIISDATSEYAFRDGSGWRVTYTTGQPCPWGDTHSAVITQKQAMTALRLAEAYASNPHPRSQTWKRIAKLRRELEMEPDPRCDYPGGWRLAAGLAALLLTVAVALLLAIPTGLAALDRTPHQAGSGAWHGLDQLFPTAFTATTVNDAQGAASSAKTPAAPCHPATNTNDNEVQPS